MKIGVLTGSISRQAGGLFESVRRPVQELQGSFPVDVRVFGLEDRFSQADLSAWGTLSVRVFPVMGPRAFGYALGLAPALRTAALDLMQVEGIWMYPSLACLGWAKATGKPYLVRPHGMLDPWAVRNSRWKKFLAGYLYENDHLRGAACLLALCESEARSIRAYGLRNPVAIIPNGIDLPTPRLKPKNHAAGNPLRLLYLGRLHPKKGLAILLQAWGTLHRRESIRNGTWELAISGWDQSGHEDELKLLCRQTGIDGSVRFLGPRFGADKDAAYREADAFVLPSFSEGLPMVVLEAWAYGLAVIMTPQCNIPEGFAMGAAIKVEPNPHEIERGLLNLFEMSDSERQVMGERGVTLVKKRFTWPIVADEMRAIHEWVLGGGTPPTSVRVES